MKAGPRPPTRRILHVPSNPRNLVWGCQPCGSRLIVQQWRRVAGAMAIPAPIWVRASETALVALDKCRCRLSIAARLRTTVFVEDCASCHGAAIFELAVKSCVFPASGMPGNLNNPVAIGLVGLSLCSVLLSHRAVSSCLLELDEMVRFNPSSLPVLKTCCSLRLGLAVLLHAAALSP